MDHDELESELWHALTAYDTGRIPADKFIDHLIALADRHATGLIPPVATAIPVRTRKVRKTRNRRTGQLTPTAKRRAILNDRYPPQSLKEWEELAARVKL